MSNDEKVRSTSVCVCGVADVAAWCFLRFLLHALTGTAERNHFPLHEGTAEIAYRHHGRYADTAATCRRIWNHFNIFQLKVLPSQAGQNRSTRVIMDLAYLGIPLSSFGHIELQKVEVRKIPLSPCWRKGPWILWVAFGRRWSHATRPMPPGSTSGRSESLGRKVAHPGQIPWRRSKRRRLRMNCPMFRKRCRSECKR